MAKEKRLIDANALIDEIAGIYQRHYINSAYQFIHDFFRAAFRRIYKAPTVDAVEVVRCKNCKHYSDSPYDNGDMMCDRWGEWIFPNDDDFCSCGERKDNG